MRFMIIVKAETLEWTKRFANPVGGGKQGEIEVRQLFRARGFRSERNHRPVSRHRRRHDEIGSCARMRA
jgi:hypothetical protein